MTKLRPSSTGLHGLTHKSPQRGVLHLRRACLTSCLTPCLTSWPHNRASHHGLSPRLTPCPTPCLTPCPTPWTHIMDSHHGLRLRRLDIILKRESIEDADRVEDPILCVRPCKNLEEVRSLVQRHRRERGCCKTRHVFINRPNGREIKQNFV